MKSLPEGSIDLVIPEMIDGISVTSISDKGFIDFSSLQSVKIPLNVTFIGNESFRGCPNIINIDISNSVTTIGNAAFLGCSALPYIFIPQSVIIIKSGGTFSSCTSLKSIDIDRPKDSISGSAWSAPSSTIVNWLR